MKKVVLSVLILIVLIGVSFSVSGLIPNKLNLNNPKVNESVQIIVKLNNSIDKVSDSGMFAADTVEPSWESNGERYGDYVVLNVTSDELKEIYGNPRVESVSRNYKIHALDSDSNAIIGANKVWPLQLKGLNLTGAGETICEIDTGVDFEHPDLEGKNDTCVIDCMGGTCSENCGIGDDNGHGTHVAGIMAASGGITGVAPGIKLIGVKVLNSSGGGNPNTGAVDLANAINWCVNHRTEYNISVITMSLGTKGDTWEGYCDNDISIWANPIHDAISDNISVVVAAGNDGSHSEMAAPACISGVISVGATNKDDSIAGYSDYDTHTSLFAPGTSILSTIPPNPSGEILTQCGSNKEYCSLSGTSMATPHVSASIALLDELYRLEGRNSVNSSDLLSVLQNHGKRIETSDGNITRINVYNALISIDNEGPSVNLISPNYSKSLEINQTFLCNATDLDLNSIGLKIWNSTGLWYNYSSNVNGSYFLLNVSVDNMSYGNYKFGCFAEDKNDNVDFSENKSLLIGLDSELDSPEDNVHSNSENQTFLCNSTSYENLSKVKFYLWNTSGNLTTLIYNETENVSGFNNLTIFNYNFTLEGNYTWNCLASSVDNISVFSDRDYSIVYDTSPPNLTINSPENNSWFNGVGFNVSLSEKGFCNYSLDLGKDNLTMENTSDLSEEFYAENLSLQEYGNYTVNYYCSDLAGNKVSKSSKFEVDLSKPNVTLIYPENKSKFNEGKTLGFKFNVSDNLNISKCSLLIDNLTVTLNSSEILENSTNEIFYKPGVGEYRWEISCKDKAGNVGNSILESLTVNKISHDGSGDSGSSGNSGGGGSFSSGNTGITEPEFRNIYSGYNQGFTDGESIKFKIVNQYSSENHKFIVDKIGRDFVNVTVESKPINLFLKVGEIKLLNLSSDKYYDLKIKLNSIENGVANITLLQVKIPINKYKLVAFNSNSENVSENRLNKTSPGKLNRFFTEKTNLVSLIVALIFLFVAVLIYSIERFIVFERDKDKRRKKTLKEISGHFDKED